MKIKKLVLFFVMLFSMSFQAQNSIDIVNPPATVEGNSYVNITFNYTLAVPGYAYIRFKNGPDTANNLTYVSKLLAAGSGTETLSLEIPRSFNGVPLPLGNGYNFQAQLFDHNNGWAGLGTKDYNGVTLTAAANFISLTTYPTTVNVNGSVDVTFNYATNKTAPVYAFVRLHNTATGAQVATTTAIELSTTSGTKTANLAIPNLTLGSGYEYRVLLFHPSNWNAAFASDKVIGISAAAAVAPANSITIVNPPTTVTGGRMIDFSLSYITDQSAAYALIRFKGPTGNLEQKYVLVNSSSGTVKLSVLSPETGGSNYSLQAQLFTTGWSHLVTENVTGITVNEYIPTGQNTLEIVNTATGPINNGDIRQVSVKYNLLQTSKILVEIRDKPVVAGSKKIGEVSIVLPAGNDTVTLDLVVNGGHPGASNRIQATLFNSDGSTSISIPETPNIVVAKGDGTITYRGQPYTTDGSQSNLFAESLGEGYYTNYYIATGWKGPLQMKFGQFGSPSWIEYENQNTVADGHKEFDIKIQKFSWHAYKDYFTNRGFPTALKDINYPLPTTMEGQWSAGSGGKGQINMTAWITETGDMAGKRIDIIVETFNNSGNSRLKYDNNTVASDGHVFNNIGEITANNGLVYQVLRTLPGYLGEVASYNLVPDALVQVDVNANYTNATIISNVDIKDIIDKLIVKEANYAGTKVAISNTWQINGLEWTVVGQSTNYDAANKLIPSGHGKFTFNSYSIPNLIDPGLGTDHVDYKFKNLNIYPNPCTDSFTYKIEGQVSEPANVELFSIDGRKVKMDNSYITSSSNNIGTVHTGHLSNGNYLVRVTSGHIQETRKLIKK